MSVSIGILDVHEGFGEESWFINNFFYTKLSDELKEYIHFEKISSINDLFVVLHNRHVNLYNRIYIPLIFYL